MTSPAYPQPPTGDVDNPIIAALLPGQIPKADDNQQLAASGLRVDPLTDELTVAQVTVLGKIRLGETTVLTGGGALLLHDKALNKNFSLIQVEFDDAGSLNSTISKLSPVTTENVNTDNANVVTSDTFSFALDNTKDFQVNELIFEANGPMLNISLQITDNVSGDVIKHIPSKGVFDAGIGGFDFIAGINTIDLIKQALAVPVAGDIRLGLNPFRSIQGQQFDVIMKSNVIDLKGDATVNPFLDAVVQKITETVIGDTSKDFAFAYHNADQTPPSINAWEDMLWSTNTGLDGWTHAAGSSDFICPTSRNYVCILNFGVESNNVNKIFSVRGFFDGAEVVSSARGRDIIHKNNVIPFPAAFLFEGVKDKIFKIQISTDDPSTKISIPPFAAAPVTPTAATIAILRAT